MQNNPYVGPRPYTRADRERFFGRNREARDLFDLLMAERVVLFYAQSGAGKSSLLNAKIIPDLEDQGFETLPPARVGLDIPLGIAPEAVDNVYVFSTLLSLADPDTDVASLLEHTLLSFLQQCLKEESASATREMPVDDDADKMLPILIWDQFEELFTTHRERWSEAAGFFEQVRTALESIPELGVVFVMREDHVAAIEPYAALLPRRLRARFRMERLRYAGALEAVRKPAELAACPFDKGVAEQLVDNLRRIKRPEAGSKTQEADGGGRVAVLGPYIEPVQLQVVCSRLWDNLPEQGDKLIQWQEVAQFGDVDQALTDFYEETLQTCLQTCQVSENLTGLRRWFGEQLITPMQTRGLVMRGADETGGLPNAAVDVLADIHIIRAEARAGARWYELCHDRFVEPVLKSNAAWAAARETPLRLAARRWQETGEASLLYRDAALTESWAWLVANAEDVEAYEQEFLDASQQAEHERMRRRHLAIAGTVVGAVIVVLMTVLTILAVNGQREARIAEATAEVKQQEAEESEAIAEVRRVEAEEAQATAEEQTQLALENLSRQLATQAENEWVEHNPDLALLLGIESLRAAETLDAVLTLRDFLARESLTRLILTEPISPVVQVQWSPSNDRVAAATSAGTVWVWDARSGAVWHKLPAADAEVLSLRWNRAGTQLLTAGRDNKARVWDVATGAAVLTLSHAEDVYSALWNADESRILTASKDNFARVWDVVTGAMLLELEGPVMWRAFWNVDETLILTVNDAGVQVWAAATGEQRYVLDHAGVWIKSALWNQAGTRILTSDDQGVARVWDAVSGELLMTLNGHQNWLNAALWNPDETLILTVSADGTAGVWDAETGRLLLMLVGHAGEILSAAWSADGSLILTTGVDGTARIWDAQTGAAYFVLAGHTGRVNSAQWSADNSQILTGSFDKTVRVWDFNLLGQPRGELPVLVDAGRMLSARWNRAGDLLLTANSDGAVRVWDAATRAELLTLQHEGTAQGALWDADETRILTFGDDGARVWDAATGVELLALIGHTTMVNSAIWFADDQRIATASEDGTGCVWDAASGEQLHCLEGHASAISVVSAPTMAGRVWLLTAGGDGAVQVWDLERDELVHILQGHTGSVWRAIGNGDASRWLTASADGTARVWDAATGVELLRLAAVDGGNVWAAGWGPDEVSILTAGSDGVARLWDASTGQLQTVFVGHNTDILNVAWHPDGTRLCTAGADGVFRQFYVQTADLLTAACQHTWRNMTSEEWALTMRTDESYRVTCSR